jgi:hypothetical protein
MCNLTLSRPKAQRFLIGLALVQAFGTLAFGAVIYDSSAAGELTGSRSDPATSGVVTTMTSFQIGWTITNTGPSAWHYIYTISGVVASGGLGLSHFILDTSDNCINTTSGTFTDANCVTNATISAGTVTLVPGDYSSAGGGNPNFPVGPDIIGVKFNVVGGPAIPVTIAFDSDRAPVYGDFYAKVANSSTSYNNGLTNHASTTLSDFIARPDTSGSVIPEPAAWLLSSGGLLLLGFVRSRMKAASATARS